MYCAYFHFACLRDNYEIKVVSQVIRINKLSVFCVVLHSYFKYISHLLINEESAAQ